MSFGMDDLVFRADNLISSRLDGEIVLLSIDQGKYFGLDSIGSLIWELMAQPRTVGDICDKLMERFQVERAVCERDVTEFLENLQVRSMLGSARGSADQHS